MKKVFEKKYTVKEGQDDWKVWSYANDYLFEFMLPKRKNDYIIRELKKSITVKIEVFET